MDHLQDSVNMYSALQSVPFILTQGVEKNETPLKNNCDLKLTGFGIMCSDHNIYKWITLISFLAERRLTRLSCL